MFNRIKLFCLLTMLSAVNFIIAGQSDTCYLNVSTTPATQIGGLYVTASGTINVLFVYVQFPDDNYWINNSNWPKGQAPVYMASTVDAVWSSTPTTGSITDFFNQMSFNSLKVVGTEVSVITPHTRVWYLNNGKQAGFIHQEVLQQIDETMDFAQFDNWQYNSDNSHSNTANGVVDMIFMMWRNIDSDTIISNDLIRKRLDLEPGGYAALGATFTVDDDARNINGSYGGNQSGVTVIHPVGGDLNSDIIWRYARHEFSHYLLGGNNYHTDLGMWGLTDGWGTPSECVNSFERERLGWMNFNTIDDISTTRTITNVTLPDFITTNTAYRIKVPGGGADEYYLLENHQRISAFDIPDANNPTAKGLYVIRQRNSNGNGSGVVSAEGKNNWSVPYTLPNIYGGSGNLPVFQQGLSNRISGKSRRERIPWSSANHAIHYQLINEVVVKAGENGNPTVFTGTGKDQFDMSNNTVFSPASNPSSVGYSSNADSIAFEITGISNGVITLNIHVNNPLDASPSKPQDIAIQTYQNGYDVNPKLTWTAAGETDVTTGGNVVIERRVKDMRIQSPTWSSWATIATIGGSNNSYTDQSITTAGAGNDLIYEYRIRFKDSQDKYSIYSNTISIGASADLSKRGFTASEQTPNKYSLDQNIPNPFNPSTTIRYQIPVNAHVELRVFNLLGSEIAILTNGYKTAGKYEINFDASSLSSGMYIYRLQAGKYIESRKMMVLK